MNKLINVPNTLTCCNLICGAVATQMAFLGKSECAMLFIMLGAFFDFFDGLSARALKISSDIGKELDSLADVVTFGLAPSSMLFSMLQQYVGELACPVAPYLPYLAFLMVAFSALRLAKFNLDTRQTMEFIGMPTPANALFWGSLVMSGDVYSGLDATFVVPALLILMCGSSFLLISEVPMLALKFKTFSWKGNAYKYTLLLGCVPCFLLGKSGFSVAILWYVCLSVVRSFFSGKSY